MLLLYSTPTAPPLAGCRPPSQYLIIRQHYMTHGAAMHAASPWLSDCTRRAICACVRACLVRGYGGGDGMVVGHVQRDVTAYAMDASLLGHH